MYGLFSSSHIPHHPVTGKKIKAETQAKRANFINLKKVVPTIAVVGAVSFLAYKTHKRSQLEKLSDGHHKTTTKSLPKKNIRTETQLNHRKTYPAPWLQ